VWLLSLQPRYQVTCQAGNGCQLGPSEVHACIIMIMMLLGRQRVPLLLLQKHNTQ
jgi:hypothetical protein